MNLLNLYLSSNILLIFCWILVVLWSNYSFISFRRQLKAIQSLTPLIILVPLFLSFAPQESYTLTTAQVWAPLEDAHISPSKNEPSFRASSFLNKDQQYDITPAFSLLGGISFIFLIGFLVTLIQYGLDYWRLRQIYIQSYLIRRIGRVHIRISDEIELPFACRFPLSSMVFLPSSMLFHPHTMKLAIYHELQHHRQRDTSFSYLLAAYKCLFFFNPFIYLYEKKVTEIQEYACDEAVVGHKKVSSLEYSRCLIEVAKTVLRSRRPLLGTASMAAASSKLKLTRRLDMLLNKPIRKKNFSFVVVFLSLISLSVVAFGSRSMVKDRRIEMKDALRYQSQAQLHSSFPIDINPSVLRQLNRFLGSPEGRKFMKNSLVRMEKYRAMVEDKLSSHNIPSEILALPIIESGYRNISQAHSSGNGAGLWQFIESTARHFGMVVNSEVDERLNEEKETLAAVRYLHRNNLVFQDWRLALMSYNMGEKAVFDAIRKTETRDPWKLIEKGFEGDPDYLAKFMAATLIMKNPHVLD